MLRCRACETSLTNTSAKALDVMADDWIAMKPMLDFVLEQLYPIGIIQGRYNVLKFVLNGDNL